jgi:YidC/Oxa1 family membrane protein insertase
MIHMMKEWLVVAALAPALCSAAPFEDGRVETGQLELEFERGGRLESAVACFPDCTAGHARRGVFSGSAAVIEPEFDDAGAWRQSRTRTDRHHLIRFDRANGDMVLWRVPLEGYVLELETSGLVGITLRSGEGFRPRPSAGFGHWLEQTRYVGVSAGGTRQLALDDPEESRLEADRWAGYRNRFWTLLTAAAAAPDTGFELQSGEANQDARLQTAFDGGSYRHVFYLGPVEPRILAASGDDMEDILYAGLWFWLRWICFGLFYLLMWIQALIPAWGLAVMVLSLAVHILMLPLSRIADRVQQQVNETEARLSPRIAEIKKSFKGEEQAAKILALYKTERVHPLYSLKSMLGVAVVIPVFIGAFDMLAENIHLLNTPFLWVKDLSRPDAVAQLPFALPFFGSGINLLPFLMTGLSVWASALHKPLALDAFSRRRQVRNMLLLALVFFVLFYTFPAGMVLYWTMNNLISVAKSLWRTRYNSAFVSQGD